MKRSNFEVRIGHGLIFLVLVFIVSFTPIITHASTGFFTNLWCNVTELFGFTCESNIITPVPEVTVVPPPPQTPPPLPPAQNYQIINSTTETPNTTIVEEHHTTNPTTVIYQTTTNDDKISDAQFLNLFQKLTALINQTNQQTPIISRDLFTKQVDKIYEKSNDNTDNVQENLDTLQTNNAATFATNLLTVTGNTDIDGNTTVGGDLTVDGSITAGMLNVSALASAGALVAPYFTATSTLDVNSFMGNVGIGTTTPSSKLTVVGDIDISAGSAYKYNGANVITASTTLNNYFFGGAGNLTMTGANNIASGYQAFYLNTTGYSNSAYGVHALYSNTTGYWNTANGSFALQQNTTGAGNTANGASSLRFNTTGSSNTAYGMASLYLNTTGSNNTAIGVDAIKNNVSGSYNTAIGQVSLYSNTIGSYNTAVGHSAGYDINTATSTGANTVIGYNTGRGIVTGVNNTILGANVTGLSSTLSNNIIIADGAGNQRINVTGAGNVGIGTTTPSSKLSVIGSTYLGGDLTVTGTSTFSSGLTMSGTVANIILGSNWLSSDGDDEGVYVNNIGDVSIGTTTAVAKFNVSGNIYVPNNNSFVTNDASGNTVSLLSMTTANNVLITGSTVSGNLILGVPNDVGAIQFETGSGLNSVMKILNNGNIGIGTTTPNSKLTVVGNIDISTGSAYTYNGTNVITASTSLNNYFFGGAGNLTMTGVGNTGSGYQALINNTTGYNNVANGLESLRSNTTGYWNTANGYRSLYFNTTGNNNVANGAWSLWMNTSGSSNTAIGYASLHSNTAGYSNTANGLQALYANTTGNDNVALGINALYSNTTGSYNTANGSAALFSNTTGSYNTALGYQSLYTATSSDHNTAVGYQSLFFNTTGLRNSAIGRNALYSNTTGTSNTASGMYSLYSNTTGSENNANGYESLFSNTTGTSNTAVGNESLTLNTTGSSNTALGYQSLNKTTSSDSNTAVGYRSLYSNTTGSNNTALGLNSGRFIADGVTGNATTSNSVFLGYDTRALASGDTNEVVIGYQAIGNGSNSVTLGNTNITKTVLQGNVGIGTTGPTVPLNVFSTNGNGLVVNLNNSTTGATLDFNGANNNGQLSVLANRNVAGTSASLKLAPYTNGKSFLFIVDEADSQKLKIRSANLQNTIDNSGTDVLTITQAGNVGIGTTTPSSKLTVTQSVDTATGGLWLSTADNTDFRAQYMSTSGVLSFYGGDTAGTLNTATLNAAGEWTNASDISYKENIENLSNGLDIALALKPRTYDIKNTDNHRIGFIAQEVEGIVPEVVGGAEGSKGISYGNLVAVAISAIQELAGKVSGFAESFTSKFITANEVKTDKLCVGQTCITETELIEFLNQSNQSSAPSQPTVPVVEKGVQENTEVTPETVPEINTEPVVNETTSEIPKPAAVTETEEVIDTNVDSGEISFEESAL